MQIAAALAGIVPWMPLEARLDDWETTAWEWVAPGESLR
jgi:hypothetical protein